MLPLDARDQINAAFYQLSEIVDYIKVRNNLQRHSSHAFACAMISSPQHWKVDENQVGVTLRIEHKPHWRQYTKSD